jgi:sugar lactone lactonase YvrE
VDSGAGTISAVNAHTHVKTVLGTGYTAPHDIVLSADGVHAYVAESPGTLLRINLSSANRAAATVIASGLNGIDQIALDEAHGVAYVAEFTASKIQRINLTTHTKTVAAAVFAPRGVLLTGDSRFLYVSSDSGTITRFDLATNTNTVIASGLNGPRHLTWADAGESVILFPQPNPTGTVLKLDLTASPPAVAAIAGPTPHDPYSVAVLSPDKLLIASAQVISQVVLTDSVFSAAGPILLGIGFVPADTTHLPNGYADTTMDPTYFYQVKDCPFGGTLPLMINWERARTLGANFYQVFIAGPGGTPVQVNQAFSDYRWSVPLNRFELITTVPTGGFYPLRATGQIWLNHWLGLLLDTTAQPNGLNTISVKLFSAQNAASEIGHSTDAGRHAALMIDNTVPTAIIEQILHNGSVVDACAIVTTPPPTFTFRITAEAPRHLRGWDLTAYWGDNQAKSVTADDYSHHVSPSRLWAGIHSVIVPPPGPTPWDATVTGDPTSIHCAHTFFLNAWDRVINGWGFIHGVASYHKSITLMF